MWQFIKCSFRGCLNRWWSILGQDQGCLRSCCRSAVSSGPFTTTCCLKCDPGNVSIDNIVALKLFPQNQFTLPISTLLKQKEFSQIWLLNTNTVVKGDKRKRQRYNCPKTSPRKRTNLNSLKKCYFSQIWLFQTKTVVVVMGEKRKGHRRQPQVMSGWGIRLTASSSCWL